MFGGANVLLSGEFQDVVNGFGANVVISGVFEDDLEVKAARITVDSTAVIKGDLAYETALFERKEGSQIMGKVIQLHTDEGKAWARKKYLFKQHPKYLAKILFWLISTLAFIITGLLVNHILPKQTEEIVSTISTEFWKNLGLGLLFLVVMPLCIVLSAFTVIGIPVAILFLFLFITMIYVSRIYVGLWVGRTILGYYKESFTTDFFWPFLTGTILLGILWFIPLIGWVFKMLILLIGLGAMYQIVWKFVKPAKTE
jgi:hypothetical protein